MKIFQLLGYHETLKIAKIKNIIFRFSLTGIVWLPCREFIAACASWCDESFTKAQPETKSKQNINQNRFKNNHTSKIILQSWFSCSSNNFILEKTNGRVLFLNLSQLRSNKKVFPFSLKDVYYAERREHRFVRSIKLCVRSWRICQSISQPSQTAL